MGNWQMPEWQKVISAVAPVLGSALGGPLGGMAGKVIGDVLIGEGDHTEEDIAKAISNASPEQMILLKQADNQFKVDMKKLDVKLEKITNEDRQDARKILKTTMLPQMVLSVIFIGGYFILLYMIFNGDLILDESIKDMANVLIGVMTANVPSIMQFWFGSSTGSKAKTAHIQNGIKH